MNRLYLLVFTFPLCQGFPLHSERSKFSLKSSDAVKSQGRQYVLQAQQQPAIASVGNQQAYGQYPSGYGTQAVQTQYEQQYDQQQQNTQQMSARHGNRGHGGVLYSRRPVPDPDKDISPPDDKKDEKQKKKVSKSKQQDDDEEK